MSLFPAPPGRGLAEELAPGAGLAVVDRGEAALQHQLEILGPVVQLLFEPGQAGVLVGHPAQPFRRGPFLQDEGRALHGVDVAVGVLALGRGGVEVGDQLHRRVHRLQLADEGEGVLLLNLRLLRVAEDERELRDDAVLAGLGGGRQDLVGGDPLVHPLQHLVRTGLRAAEHHEQACFAQGAPGGVRKARQGVDPGLAPPADAERLEAVGHLARLGFVEEEVVVVEVDRIHAVVLDQPGQVLGGALGPLHLLLAAEHADHPAEVAGVGTADRGLVDARAAAEHGRAQIGLDVDLVVGRRGQLAGPLPQPLGPDPVRAVGLAEGEAGDGLGIASPVDRLQQLQEGLLALAPDQPVDVGRVQHRRGVEAAEVAAPDDRDVGELLLHGLGQRHGADQLRPRHDGHGHRLDGIGPAGLPLDVGGDGGHGIDVGQVAVDDLPGDVRRQGGADRHHRQGEAPVRRPRGAGVHQDDHGRTPVHRSKRDGARAPRSQASSALSSYQGG